MQQYLNDKGYSVCSLYSGSKGNSMLVRTREARILIDAGKSARALTSALLELGEDISKIDAIFITHEHCDHIRALEVILKKHKIPVHIVQASANKLLRGSLAELSDCFCIHQPIFNVEVGNMCITSFPTPHDSEFSVGYRIDVAGDHGVSRIGYATDIGYVSSTVRESLLGCETVVLECNHDSDMLMSGPYPYDLKLRIASKKGHLSNRECADLAAELCSFGTKNLLLAHLSEENNDPRLAYDEVFAAIADERVNIKIADQNESVVLL